ncbi:MAG: Gfo/Idh/MocA family protein [Hasllibacter sp.]
MTLRFGILGAAKFAREHMGPAIHAAEGCEVAALGSTSGRGFGWHPSLRVHPSYEAVIEDPGVDALYVPLPNHLHVEWAERAAAAGKPVLVEKPAAMDVAGIDRLIAARDRAGVAVAEAFMIVHHPQWAMARDLLADGAIGAVRQVDVAFAFRNVDGANIRNRPETGGGALADIGCYAIGGPVFALGADLEVTRARIETEGGVDTAARFAGQIGGAAYAATVSTRLAPRQSVVFHGEDGVLSLPVPFNARVFGQAELHLASGTETRVWRWPAADHYVRQVEAFAAAVAGGAAFAPALEWTRRIVAAVGAVRAAAA